MGSRNCFLSLFCGIIIEKELHVLNKHKVRLSLSLFALLSRRGGGDEEEEEEQQQEGKESLTEYTERFVFVIYNFRNARAISLLESSHHEKKTNKNRNVIQFDILKKKKNKPKGASSSITFDH